MGVLAAELLHRGDGADLLRRGDLARVGTTLREAGEVGSAGMDGSPSPGARLRRSGETGSAGVRGTTEDVSVSAAGPAGPSVSRSERFAANLSISLAPTSVITPRPNWAGRPVTLNDVSTVTLVSAPSG
nr:hypothetical protein GCM10020093_089810 [Planobispora longispora]